MTKLAEQLREVPLDQYGREQFEANCQVVPGPPDERVRQVLTDWHCRGRERRALALLSTGLPACEILKLLRLVPLDPRY